MAEGDLMRLLEREASRLGARLFRQQTGMGWIGKARRYSKPQRINVHAGDVVISAARPFHSGFVGWADLGGFSPVVITPDMVGTTVAVYTQAEVKTDDGKSTKEQDNWLDFVRKHGGRAGIVRNIEELRIILGL